jgi:hypothetical protein
VGEGRKSQVVYKKFLYIRLSKMIEEGKKVQIICKIYLYRRSRGGRRKKITGSLQKISLYKIIEDDRRGKKSADNLQNLSIHKITWWEKEEKHR